jgi:putative tryptophan/tyrosine transport system substrate-binding protein
VKHRLPIVVGSREYVEAGGLASYGTDFPDLFRRAAVYVDKILKGAKPADLPVEQPTKFELVIKPQDRQGARAHDPAVLAAAGRRDYPVMDRRVFISCIAISLLAAPLAVEAQPAGKIPQIGFLVAASASDSAYARLIEAFRQGLRDLGYVEGRNIVVEYRYADGKYERLPALAAELVRLKVDVIVSHGTNAPLAAKKATSAIPIVMTSAGDPVGSGLVSSLARPGGNVTGLSLMIPELGGKRLQLLKEILPGLSRVAVLWNAANPYASLVVREMEATATTLGVQLQSLVVRGPDDFEGALAAATTGRAGALTAVEDPLTITKRRQIVDFAAKRRLPAIYGVKEFVDAGGLMSYGANFADLWRRSATYVDKILKGAKPADLPVQQPTKFEFVINLKTAKALGLTIPPSVLLRADEVIR